MQKTLKNQVYQFEEFRLETGEHLLFRGEQRINLSPRTFALLVTLVENAGHLLEKERLIREVWADSVVEEGNLNRTISNLRKALGEKPDENRFIETVPRLGYRFIAPVKVAPGVGEEPLNHQAQDVGAPQSKATAPRLNSGPGKVRWLVPLLALVCALFVAFGFLVWRNRQSLSPASPDATAAYEPRRLTDSPHKDSHPQWTPDGRLRFLRSEANRQASSWVMNADGSNQQAVKDFPALQYGIWSPDGRKVIFTKPNDKSSRYMADADGANEMALLPFSGNCAWSADSKQLVYQKTDEPGNSEIYLYTLETGKTQNLTNSPKFEADLSFSPDGRQIVFASNRNGNFELFQLYLMNLDGSNQHRIYYSGGISSSPAWSPDGREIIFANDKEDSRSGNFEIFSIEPETTEAERRLTFRQRYDVFPAFSPDGRKIAFVSEADGNPEIYLMNADGTGRLRLTRNQSADVSPRFSPDGRRLIFSSQRDGDFAIYMLDIQ
jgi:Tol biopolymer transport system component/DNA-binding winged helix-turn-helix (wHTH) protein